MRSIKGSNSCRWSMVVLAPQAYGGSTTVSNMCSKTFWTRSSFPARVSNRRSSNICSGGFHEPVRSALVPSSGRRPNGPSRCRRPRRWPPSPGDRDALGRPDIVGGPEGGTPRGTDSPTRRPESRAASRPPRDATGGSGAASPGRAGAAPPRASGPIPRATGRAAPTRGGELPDARSRHGHCARHRGHWLRGRSGRDDDGHRSDRSVAVGGCGTDGHRGRRRNRHSDRRTQRSDIVLGRARSGSGGSR